MVVCLERGAYCLHMVQLMPLHPKTPSYLASFKSRLVVPAYSGCPGKEAVKPMHSYLRIKFVISKFDEVIAKTNGYTFWGYKRAVHVTNFNRPDALSSMDMKRFTFIFMPCFIVLFLSRFNIFNVFFL